MRVCLLILLFVNLEANAVIYSNGDVRLTVNGSSAITNTRGVLEVFLNNRWGTVCSNKFNEGSAAAACRQLGFIDSTSFGLPSKYNIEPPKIYPVLTDVECHTGDDYASSGYLHILRCPHSAATNGSCYNNDVIALSCDSTLITANPYNGQVRLIDGGIQSSGWLEIYLHKEWGTVCATEFNDAAADSACRQLGYTEALNFTQIASSLSSPVWIESIKCTQSESCFSTNCISGNPSRVTSGPCANHAMDVWITCVYISTDDGTLLSGNEFICHINSTDVLIIVVAAVFGFLFLSCLCILVICLICCYTVQTCPLYAHKQKRKYEGLI